MSQLLQHQLVLESIFQCLCCLFLEPYGSGIGRGVQSLVPICGEQLGHSSDKEQTKNTGRTATVSVQRPAEPSPRPDRFLNKGPKQNLLSTRCQEPS
eukprot:1834378-Amphidinium_carterae.1